jgi:hypothetical protein
MTSYDTSLDSLPVELLFRVLNHLSTMDIYYRVSLVNRRLRAVALSYSYFESNTQNSEFKHLCNRLHPTQISSLCLSVERMKCCSSGDCFLHRYRACPRLDPLDYFFSVYQNRFDQFDHLRSLDLSGISDEAYLRILNRLRQAIPQLLLNLYMIKDMTITHFITKYSSSSTMRTCFSTDTDICFAYPRTRKFY